MAVEDVHLSKVQDSAKKAASLGQITRAFFVACRDFREFHQSNQNGEYGSGGSIFDPNNQERETTLAGILDDSEGFIKNTGISRADHAAMVALAFDVADEDNVNHFATEFRRFLAQRVAG